MTVISGMYLQGQGVMEKDAAKASQPCSGKCMRRSAALVCVCTTRTGGAVAS